MADEKKSYEWKMIALDVSIGVITGIGGFLYFADYGRAIAVGLLGAFAAGVLVWLIRSK